jgi:hypothetical protein
MTSRQEEEPEQNQDGLMSRRASWKASTPIVLSEQEYAEALSTSDSRAGVPSMLTRVCHPDSMPSSNTGAETKRLSSRPAVAGLESEDLIEVGNSQNEQAKTGVSQVISARWIDAPSRKLPIDLDIPALPLAEADAAGQQPHLPAQDEGSRSVGNFGATPRSTYQIRISGPDHVVDPYYGSESPTDTLLPPAVISSHLDLNSTSPTGKRTLGPEELARMQGWSPEQFAIAQIAARNPVLPVVAKAMDQYFSAPKSSAIVDLRGTRVPETGSDTEHDVGGTLSVSRLP